MTTPMPSSPSRWSTCKPASASCAIETRTCSARSSRSIAWHNATSSSTTSTPNAAAAMSPPLIERERLFPNAANKLAAHLAVRQVDDLERLLLRQIAREDRHQRLFGGGDHGVDDQDACAVWRGDD